MAKAQTTGTPRTLDGEYATAAQRARRDRIIAATTMLASKGGFDAVQMREVAERADVALGTLYRYFPSKVHLLVSAMFHEVDSLQLNILKRPPEGDTAAERVIAVLRRATRALQRSPQLAEGMIRALVFADASVASEVENVDKVMTEIIIAAMHGENGEPTAEQLSVVRVITRVWISSLITWLGGRSSAAQLNEDLEVAVRLLLPE